MNRKLGLTQEQQKALVKLEKAFGVCAEAGLVFFGIDSKLHGADKAILDLHACPLRMCLDGTCSTGINTHGTYQDSGGA